jgi:hypothetical protein
VVAASAVICFRAIRLARPAPEPAVAAPPVVDVALSHQPLAE